MSAFQIPRDNTLEASTQVSDTREQRRAGLSIPALTVLAHPQVSYVGARVLLPALTSGKEVALSRQQPLFAQPGKTEASPLADSHLSRKPVLLIPGEAGSIRLDAGGARSRIEIFGSTGRESFSAEELEAGVCLLLGGYVALLLHLHPPGQPTYGERYGLIGDSAALTRLRGDIRRTARAQAPVLLRGESGTGKELVARALHQASKRRAKPYVTLNLGAVPASLAAAELFGASRGAFTGADQPRQGYFERADGGTLFLDEIGEAQPEVQALLLRTLESGEIQSVGTSRPRRVDVRVIAATDADLETQVTAERFRAPLLYRLQAESIRLPPLRIRRDDIGRLLLHFLRQEFEHASTGNPIDEPGRRQRPWLSARLVARLACAPWPGNVRELRNVARRLVSEFSSEQEAELPAELEAELFADEDVSSEAGAAAAPVLPTKHRPRRQLRPVTQVPAAQILAELRASRFNLTLAAQRLRVSRTGLYGWVERHPELRKASDLERGEIIEALSRAGGDLDDAAEHLGVSSHGLRLRRTALGLD